MTDQQAAQTDTGAKSYFVSECCEGEKCWCGNNAEHKVEETVFHDDPLPGRHPLTSYICQPHFAQLMGPAALRVPPAQPAGGEIAELVAEGRRLQSEAAIEIFSPISITDPRPMLPARDAWAKWLYDNGALLLDRLALRPSGPQAAGGEDA